MLYAATRNDRDAFTVHRMLRDGRSPDGGLFVPFRLPVLSEEELSALGSVNCNTATANILNLFFGTHLTGYDIDLHLGHFPVRLLHLNQRIILAECWHNLQWQFARMEECLISLVKPEGIPSCEGAWEKVGVRIAVLFGIFGELIRCGSADRDNPVDISMVCGDFSAPMAAWYARAMGLPIGNIVCCCNANSNLWDFICHGQMRTDGVAVHTAVSEGDVVVPVGIERLIHGCCGTEEACRFAECLHNGKTYYLDERLLHSLRKGIYVTVSSDRRILQTIPSACATHGCILSPASALAYAGLEDYRARTAESRRALVMTDISPKQCLSAVAAAMGVGEEELKRIL